jgi:lipopolysaccharide export system ATP-binding protein
MQMNTLLKVENLHKAYKAKKAVDGIDLYVKSGEIVGLFGPNGAGKTSCFYIIIGLMAADMGRVFIENQDITHLPLYQRAKLGIGYLPQEASIFRGMTTEDNIMSVLEIVQPNADTRKQMLENLLNEFQLQQVRKSPAIALSGGERRRLEIARALAPSPKLLLLDEPFAGVDPIAINDIRNLILYLKQRGISVLITDHNIKETLEIIDRGYIVFSGKILMQGTKEDIIHNPDVKKYYLGNSFK